MCRPRRARASRRADSSSTVTTTYRPRLERQRNSTWVGVAQATGASCLGLVMYSRRLATSSGMLGTGLAGVWWRSARSTYWSWSRRGPLLVQTIASTTAAPIPTSRPPPECPLPVQSGSFLNELPDARACARESPQRTSLTAAPPLRLPAAAPGSARFRDCSFRLGAGLGGRLLRGAAFCSCPNERPQCETLLHDEVTTTGALLRSPLIDHAAIIANVCSFR